MYNILSVGKFIALVVLLHIACVIKDCFVFLLHEIA